MAARSNVFENIDEQFDAAPTWLSSVHLRAEERLKTLVAPGKKTENWRYTSLRALENSKFTNINESEARNISAGLYTIEGLESVRIVFVDGVFSEALSDSLSIEGVDITLFSAANDFQAQLIKNNLGSIAGESEHPFALVNQKNIGEGIFISVSRNTRVNKAIQLVHVTTKRDIEFKVDARALVILESGAQLTLVEQFVSTAEQQNSFVNNVTECIVRDNAELNHYRLQYEQESALHIGAVHSRLFEYARLNSFYLSLGSQLKRCDVYVDHAGQGSECNLNGIYLPKNKQLVDYHTCVDHSVPHCTTKEVFRGVVADRARAVFNGRIHILPDAQKTLAQMSNKNLLTSNTAEVDTKPELEIYADDVQCAHGATVAQLDENSLHYLRTRGIDEKNARVMLSYGFINELVDNLGEPAIAQSLRPMLHDFFYVEQS